MSDTAKPDHNQPLPRRDFMRSAALAAAGMTIVPRHVLGGQGFTAPSDLVNVAGVGVGGMGRSNMTALSSQNIVALCDVDWGYVDRSYQNIPQQIENMTKRLKEAPASVTAEQRAGAEEQMAGLRQLHEKAAKATRYTDFRQMLEKQKDIDAVMVATPDHTHAVIALAAMSLGKHVYVQKPLAWSVEECRLLGKKAADNPKIVTQMGNQGHSSDGARLVNEIIAAKLIGDVSEVHVWTNRPLTHWPQGVPRPAALDKPADQLPWNLGGVMARLANAMGKYPVPDKLNWDLFLGPAPQAEYHPIYHPFNWRGWTDWGVGAIGDMGAHLIDHPFWALDLSFPTSIETQSTPYDRRFDEPGPRSYPMSTTTYYTFPAKGSRPAVKMTWYDGGLLPPKPAELGEEELNKGGGVLYIGSKGKLLHDNYGGNPRLLPKAANDAMQTPPQLFERITTSHELNWIGAIKGNGKASSPFSYAAPLTETMLLGVVALNAGKRIEYDGANMRITNAPEANRFLKREYRQGWALT
jgi:predicted dehydrogenase